MARGDIVSARGVDANEDGDGDGDDERKDRPQREPRAGRAGHRRNVKENERMRDGRVAVKPEEEEEGGGSWVNHRVTRL